MYWQLHKFELSVCIFCNIFYERINMKPVGMLKQTFNECIAIDWHYNFRPFQTNYILYPLRFTKKHPIHICIETQQKHLLSATSHWDSLKYNHTPSLAFCTLPGHQSQHAVPVHITNCTTPSLRLTKTTTPHFIQLQPTILVMIFLTWTMDTNYTNTNARRSKLNSKLWDR